MTRATILFTRWTRRISGAALASITATLLHAQALEFEGSIFNLDPPALQSTDLEQVIGSDETTPLNQFHETDYYRRLGKPIGRLAVEFLNGKSAYCTASLIADDLILTNAHCLLDSTGNNIVRAGLLWMGYLTAGEAEGGAQFIVDMRNPVEVGFPGADGAPDYAILKVQSGAPGKDWGTVRLSSRAPADRSSLVVVHHHWAFRWWSVQGASAARRVPRTTTSIMSVTPSPDRRVRRSIRWATVRLWRCITARPGRMRTRPCARIG